MSDTHFYNSSKEWEAPETLFQPLKKEFNIMLDVCASAENTKCKAYIDRKLNSFNTSWFTLVEQIKQEETVAVWMNPPYGRGIDKWVKKAHEEAGKGVTVVALLPARTDTSWFHNYIYNKHEVRFLKGRVKFVDAKAPVPFPSMIVIFKPTKKLSLIQSIWKKLK